MNQDIAFRRDKFALDDAGLRLGQGERVHVRFYQRRRTMSGVQVVVEDAMHCSVAHVLAVARVGLLGGVGTEQVVEGVPARGVLGEQVRAGQLGQRSAGPVWRDRGQARRGGAGDIGARMQAQQPEHPRRVVAQGAVGPGEHRPDVGSGITSVEGVKSAGRLAQLGGQDSQREAGTGGGPGGGGHRRSAPTLVSDRRQGRSRSTICSGSAPVSPSDPGGFGVGEHGPQHGQGLHRLGGQRFGEPGQDLLEELLLGPEVVHHQPGVRPGRPCDAADRGVLVTGLDELAGRRGQDPRLSAPPLLGDGEPTMACAAPAIPD
jgi:hypothetical protein